MGDVSRTASGFAGRMTKPPVWPIVALVVTAVAVGAFLLMFLRALLVLP
jgi:hypothetical protein